MATFSTPVNSPIWLWNVLSHNVPPNHWRAAKNDKLWIASSHTIISSNNNIVSQQILSNAFDGFEKLGNNVNNQLNEPSRDGIYNILFLYVDNDKHLYLLLQCKHYQA